LFEKFNSNLVKILQLTIIFWEQRTLFLNVRVTRRVFVNLCVLETLWQMYRNYLICKTFISHEDAKAPRITKNFNYWSTLFMVSY